MNLVPTLLISLALPPASRLGGSKSLFSLSLGSSITSVLLLGTTITFDAAPGTFASARRPMDPLLSFAWCRVVLMLLLGELPRTFYNEYVSTRQGAWIC